MRLVALTVCTLAWLMLVIGGASGCADRQAFAKRKKGNSTHAKKSHKKKSARKKSSKKKTAARSKKSKSKKEFGQAREFEFEIFSTLPNYLASLLNSPQKLFNNLFYPHQLKIPSSPSIFKKEAPL